MNKIRCPLSEVSARFGDQIALVENDRTITYRQFNNAVTRLAAYLRNRSVLPGDRTAVFEPNRIECVVALFALFRLGTVACLFSPRFGTGSFEALAGRAGCRSKIVFPDTAAVTDIASLRTIALPPLNEITAAIDAGDAEIDLNQSATITATSGSTGTPKLVLHTYGNHYYNALGSNRNIPVTAGDRWLVSLSMHHVGGLAVLFRCLLGGGTAVIGQPSDDLAISIERFGITHLSVVTTQLRRLLARTSTADKSGRFKSLKAVLLGGGPAPGNLLSEVRGAGLPLFTSYGLTEMASQVCTSSPGHPDIARPLDFRAVRISDEGEILVGGKTLFRGYIRGESVNRPVDADGWFATGDIGTIDKNGGLVVTGRKDNMFISGGENIHPEEIESCLLRLSEIEDAVVVPVEDTEFDHRPAAFVLCAPAHEPPPDEVLKKKLMSEGLPRFKLPVAFFPWPQAAAVNEMKPDRMWLKKEAARLISQR